MIFTSVASSSSSSRCCHIQFAHRRARDRAFSGGALARPLHREVRVWFGKPLWKKKISGVEYSLGSCVGGLWPAAARPMDIIEGKADVDREQLPPISALDKIIVAVPVHFQFAARVRVRAIVWVVGYP